MADKCEKCTEKCPQAEMAHQAALGRMYATNAFAALLKKVESGELVKVVRCKDCKHWRRHTERNLDKGSCWRNGQYFLVTRTENDYCSMAERSEGE